MLQSVSMRSIVRHHIDGFRDPSTGTVRVPDLVLHYGLPAVVGLTWGLVGPSNAGMGNFIAGLAILTGLFLSLLVYIFQLRLDLEERVDHQRSTRLLPLVDGLFHNTVYAALVCGTTTFTAVAADITNVLSRCLDALTIALGCHVALTALMVVRRAHAAYLELLRDKARSRAVPRH